MENLPFIPNTITTVAEGGSEVCSHDIEGRDMDKSIILFQYSIKGLPCLHRKNSDIKL